MSVLNGIKPIEAMPKLVPPTPMEREEIEQPKTPSVLSNPTNPVKTEAPQPAVQELPKPALDPAKDFRSFGDPVHTRKRIYEDVLNAARSAPPIVNKQFTLKLADVDYDGPEEFSLKEQKAAILEGRSLGRRLKGTWQLVDNTTGDVLDSKTTTLARVPYMTQRGTFIHGGNEYTLGNQMRLRPGIFTRLKDNGEVEAHANIMPGKGMGHRYFLDPAKGQFYIKLSQAKIPLMPVIRALGATDSQLREAWGNELYASNVKEDNHGAIKKLYDKLVSNRDPLDDGDMRRQKVVEAFKRMELDPEVMSRTLAKPYKNLDLDVILDTTKKLIGVSRGEMEVDDRDHMANQVVYGPEDLMAERIAKDAGRLRWSLLWKAGLKRNLSHIQPGALNAQIDSALLSSGLAMPLEEINLAEVLDKQTRLSRLGVGGIGSIDSIPSECYDDKTEVFTKDGWISWKDADKDTEFACRIDGKLEFNKATNLFAEQYSGPMYGLKTRTLNYLVTPNHRMWTRKYRNKSSIARCGTTEWFFETAENTHRRPRQFKLTHRAYEGSNETRFVLPAVEGAKKEYEFDFGDWGEFLGWYIAEGSIDSYRLKKYKKYSITITQTKSANPDNVRRIHDLLTRMGIKFSYQIKNFVFISKQIGKWLERVGTGSLNKYIPEECFSWPAHVRHRMLDSLIAGDGSTAKNGARIFGSGSVLLAADVSRLATTLGYAVRERKPDFSFREFQLHGRVVQKTKPYYSVALLLSKTQGVTTGKRDADNYYTCHYNGKVYCAEVPGNLLLVRREKSVPMWCGNSRSVQPSHFGFVDAIRTPESLRAGVDVHFASAVRKGPNGQIYAPFKNTKTGQIEYKSPSDISGLAIAFPGEMDKPDRRVVAMNKGKLMFVDKSKIDYVLPEFENAFSALSNLIPLKSAVKGQRVAMGSRMITQALPLEEPEAPFVQGALPDNPDRSYEEELSSVMGAVRSDNDGVITEVTPDYIKIKQADGTEKTHELYNNFILNRKTQTSNTPVVKVGQAVKPGDLLAYSNQTDKNGVMALGKNLRVAYVAAHENFEDAITISESAAKKLRSEHAYQHAVDWTDKHKVGKRAYLGMFPKAYDKRMIDALDDDGIIKPGTVVEYGQPLIVSAKQKELSQNKIHRKHEAAFSDDSQVWEHHSPGIVTDVVKTKNGVAVAVKSYEEMHTGDKLAGRFGDKSVTAKIVPDDQMPTDEQGRPVEALVNPLGIISRTNPSQIIEAVLGKIVEKTGKPYKVQDFKNIKDMTRFAMEEAKKHGVKDLETIIDPTTGNKISDVLVGNRFFMKLMHTAESKGQSRGIAGYTQSGEPAKGGDSGCFAPKQKILTDMGPVNIATICEKRLSLQVRTYSEALGEWVYRPITDWFTYRANVSDMLNIKVVAPCEGDCDGRQFTTFTQQNMYVTKNHEYIMYDGTKKQAGELVPGDELVSWGVMPTNDQEALIYGTLLGDATIYPHQLQFEHSLKQLNYARWKASVLAGLKPNRCTAFHPERYILNKKTGTEHYKKPVRSESTWINGRHYLETVHAICRTDGKKKVTKEWLDKLNGLSVSVWLLDDGSITNKAKKKGRINYAGNIATHGFSLEESEMLCDWLGDRYGVRPTVNSVGAVYLPAALCELLVYEIAGYVPWKAIPNSKRFLKKQVKKIQVNCPPIALKTYSRLGKIPVKIWDITPYKHDKEGVEEINVYDFTVDDTHTYCAGSILVSNSKRISLLDLNALLSHGAYSVLRDAGAVRGQKNEEYWIPFMRGLPPPKPKVPMIYDKFVNDLRSAGINVIPDGPRMHIMAMTDKDIDALAGDREIKNGETVQIEKGMAPVKGGLFDESLTGSHSGGRWSFIRLQEPLPNPVMEEPIRRILGLTEKKFLAVISGKEQLPDGSTGPAGIKTALEKINLPKEIAVARMQIHSGRKTLRDQAVRKLAYLKSAQQMGLHPKDWMMTKVPVLPPRFRPISMLGDSGMPLVSDPNYLYKELIDANSNLRDMSKEVEDVSEERTALYNAFKAVVGLADPNHPKLQEKNVKGVLKHLFGNSPKTGMLQRRLISSTVDLVGRAVVVPDSSMDMDHIGLPEERAWEVYKNFIIRKLHRRGLPITEAAKHVKERSKLARDTMVEEMDNRPIIVNRAPVLHRFGIMAFRPKLSKGDVVRVSPLVVGGFGMDFDGDAVQYHLPVDDDAAREAVDKMLPSRNLLSPADFKSPMHAPKNEYTGGLYAATAEYKGKKRKHVFRNAKDAITAWKAGNIDIRDDVEILDDSQ